MFNGHDACSWQGGICTFLLLAMLCTAQETARADAYANLPHGLGFRNVRDFGAKGDGVTDDTAAFRRALEEGRGVQRAKAAANVYVPPGTYVLSDTVMIFRATLFAGDSENPPVLVLKDNAPGFGDPENPKPLFVTACGYNIDPATRDWTTRTNEIGGSTNNTFFITVRHLHIKIGAGNPGAWGLYWLVAQQTALRHVTIEAGDAQGCMKSMWWGGGGVISHLNLIGGDYGWYATQTSQWVMRSCRITGQRKASLSLHDVWNFVLLDLRLEHTTPLEVRGGHVSLLDSRFEGIDGAYAVDAQDGSLVLSNVTTSGVREVVKNVLPAGSGAEVTVRLWAMGSAMVDGHPLPAQTHDLSELAEFVPRDLPSPAYPMPAASARSVTEFGAQGDGRTDDTTSIQRAIDECREVFLPEGTYVVSDTLRLRSDTKLFGEMWTFIQLKEDSPGFLDPASSKPLLAIPDDPDATTTLCHFGCQMLTPGGIRTDWQAGEKSRMLDVCFADDSKTQRLNWRISGNGGGFFENSWNPGASGDGIEVTSSGRKWLYAVQQEHYNGTAAVLDGAKNLVVLVFQFETSPRYVLVRNCENVCLFNTIAGNWGEPVPSMIHVVDGRNIALFHSAICHADAVITEEAMGWSAGPNSNDRSFARQTVWIKR